MMYSTQTLFYIFQNTNVKHVRCLIKGIVSSMQTLFYIF